MTKTSFDDVIIDVAAEWEIDETVARRALNPIRDQIENFPWKAALSISDCRLIRMNIIKGKPRYNQERERWGLFLLLKAAFYGFIAVMLSIFLFNIWQVWQALN